MQSIAHYASGTLLDVGCANKPYRELFDHVEHYIGIEISRDGAGDLIGDALSLPFADKQFDTVLCTEVLEHVPEPALLIAEAYRVLRPGGHMWLTAPQTWGLHLEPTDYYRYTVYGLRYLADKGGFEVLEVKPTCGLWATTAQRISDTVISTYGAAAPRLVVILLSVMLAPMQLLALALDAIVGKQGDTLCNVLVAKRPP